MKGFALFTLALWLAIGVFTVREAMATPSAGSKCDPMMEVLEAAQQAGITVSQIDGPQLAFATGFYNSVPPVSDKRFTIGFLAANPAGGGALMLGSGSEICGTFLFPTKEMYERFVKAMYGIGA
jgi:hypothetical protein